MIYNWTSALTNFRAKVFCSGKEHHFVQRACSARKGWLIKLALDKDGNPFLNANEELETVTVYGRVKVVAL